MDRGLGKWSCLNNSCYDVDLAYTHDAGFGGFARNAAQVLLAALEERELRRGLVVDLGCGSGILSAEVSSAGYEVLGIDLSPSLLDIARQRAPTADFREGLLFSQEIPSCVAVTGIGECFNYLFDEDNSPEALEDLFRRIHSALHKHGVLLFDVAAPGRVPPPGLVRTHFESPEWAVLVIAEEDSAQRLLTRRITTFRRAGEFYGRRHEVHQLRLLAPEVTSRTHRISGVETVMPIRNGGLYRFGFGIRWRTPIHERLGSDRSLLMPGARLIPPHFNRLPYIARRSRLRAPHRQYHQERCDVARPRQCRVG